MRQTFFFFAVCSMVWSSVLALPCKANTAPQDGEKQNLLDNPLLTQAPILFVVRPQYKPDHHNTATMFQTGEINTGSYRPGGILKTLDVKTGKVTTIFDAGPEGAIRDPEVSFDGKKILFSMRKNIKEDYHIYEINADGSGLRQLTSLPGVFDIDPIYLPNGDIVFSSSRDSKFCMCNRHIMGNLHRMESDGANIYQIGRNTLFEGHPSLLPNGQILYDRWEYVDRNFGDAQGLWTANPDGTSHLIYWGNNTGSPGAVLDARAIPGTPKIVATLGSCHDRPWGAIGIIDRRKGVDAPDAILQTWPASAKKLVNPNGSYDTFKQVNPKYEDPYPLSDEYFLCSRLTGKGEQVGIYLLDTAGNETLVYSEEGTGCFDPMPLAPREVPVMRPTQRTFDDQVGYFYLQNVYIGTHMKGVKRGEVKYLRILETPEKQTWSPSQWAGQGVQCPGINWCSLEVKTVWGMVPVEEDGSAYFEVPPDRFLFFQALDENKMAVQSMRSGTIIQPGEQQGCIGCHEDRISDTISAATNQMPMAMRRAPSQLAGIHKAPSPVSFQRDIQPIFDRHCVECHDWGKPAGEKLRLCSDRSLAYSASYHDLWALGYTGGIGAGPASHIQAKGWGSHASRLIQTIRKNGMVTGMPATGKAEEMNPDHKEVKLSPEEFEALITWTDANATYYPTYDAAYDGTPTGRSPLNQGEVNRLEQLIKTKLVIGYGSGEAFRTKISFDRPEKSPCLANLKPDSKEYQEILGLIQLGQERLAQKPRADMPGFKPSARYQQWIDKHASLRQRETANRRAIHEGRKVYDPGIGPNGTK